MRVVGIVLVVAAALVPLIWFIPLAGRHDPIAVFSQYIGSAALILMGISQLMATRAVGLEAVFGGLDRIYVLHKWIGIAAIAAILIHDTVDAEMSNAGETFLTELAETLGEISLYGILILVTLSVATFVPYHLWRYSHKVIGAFFAFSAIHFFFIKKPFVMADPAGLYVGAFCVLGMTSYLYTLLPFRLFEGRHGYKIKSMVETGGALAVSLAPQGRGMRHKAGQFAFLQFSAPDLSEVHPFTISKAPEGDRSLRFTIKNLGDFTGRLDDGLKVGDEVRISGPYGHFRRVSGNEQEIWIAAGIGITPFLAWAGSLGETKKPVHLFYCVRDRDQAAHITELEDAARNNPSLNLHLVESSKGARLTTAMITETITDPLAKSRVAFCGPKPMREHLIKDLTAAGLPASRFLYEEFVMRSGIGLRKLASWVWNKFVKK